MRTIAVVAMLLTACDSPPDHSADIESLRQQIALLKNDVRVSADLAQRVSELERRVAEQRPMPSASERPPLPEKAPRVPEQATQPKHAGWWCFVWDSFPQVCYREQPPCFERSQKADDSRATCSFSKKAACLDLVHRVNGSTVSECFGSITYCNNMKTDKLRFAPSDWTVTADCVLRE
jgi:hypothetical protein